MTYENQIFKLHIKMKNFKMPFQKIKFIFIKKKILIKFKNINFNGILFISF